MIHDACICNEIVSARNRVLGDVVRPTDDGIRLVQKEINIMAKRCGHLEPWTYEQVLDTFKGKKRLRYEQAFESLKIEPLFRKDAYIKAFVKAEKINPSAKENPDPRMIQARSFRYNLTIAKYLRPVEKYIYTLKSKSGLREVAKGLNQKERASLLIEKFSRFRRPVCYSLDCSRFDKHVSAQLLVVEHSFYQQLLPCYPEFDRLLKWQTHNKVTTQNGVRYNCVGGRMSGDINTALGNCLLMVAMVRAAMRKLGITNYEIVDDGDDCLVIVERDDESKLSQLESIFETFGHKLKLEGRATNVHHVEFCQCRVVLGADGYTMVRDWRKIISHACVGTKNWNDPNFVRPMLGLVGTCELALARGIPVLQAFAAALVRMSHGKIATFEHLDEGLAFRVKRECGSFDDVAQLAKTTEISDEARLVFEEAFGTPDWEQLEIEERLSRWELATTQYVDRVREIDHRWEQVCHPDDEVPEIY